MSRKTPHKWLLNIEPKAKRKFDSLSRSNKQAIFRKLRELPYADYPYSLPFVEMLQAKKFERIRKFRAGDYRVFIIIESTELTHTTHVYKGRLRLFDIRDRKDAY